MSGAMIVIQTGLPQGMACEGIELLAGGADRKAADRERDMTLENPREAVAHFAAGRAERNGARDIGGAVEILRAGIDKVELARLQGAVGTSHENGIRDGSIRGDIQAALLDPAADLPAVLYALSDAAGAPVPPGAGCARLKLIARRLSESGKIELAEVGGKRWRPIRPRDDDAAAHTEHVD